MKTIVVYDSTYGNTERIARCVAEVLAARVPTQVLPVAEADGLDLQAGDILVVGCPTQGHTATPAVRLWLKHFQHGFLQGVDVAAFDTRFRKAAWLTGVASRTIAKEMRRAGTTLLVPAESFFVSATKGPLEAGEMDRVIGWAEALLQVAQKSHYDSVTASYRHVYHH
jgi:flavodoxin